MTQTTIPKEVTARFADAFVRLVRSLREIRNTLRADSPGHDAIHWALMRVEAQFDNRPRDDWNSNGSLLCRVNALVEGAEDARQVARDVVLFLRWCHSDDPSYAPMAARLEDEEQALGVAQVEMSAASAKV